METAWVLWVGQREELTLAPKVQMGRGPGRTEISFLRQGVMGWGQEIFASAVFSRTAAPNPSHGPHE